MVTIELSGLPDRGSATNVKIAINAGKGKVFDVIATAVNLANNVFEVERGQTRMILMQMTIFASILSALANLSPDL